MKKVMMIAAIAAALVSCKSKGTNNNDSASTNETVMAVTENAAAEVVYKGILPAADGPGIQYVLKLDNINSTEEGTYTLETTYLEAEGAGKDKSFTSKGKKQDVNNEKKTAIKLIPDDSDTPIYFVIVNDSTLRLVNEELQEAAGELNYDIVLVR
ncbi:copper resistance protein NlpE N-terminal domain-containing protein [Bacteroides heparinolyticus]|uniref:copper resistance protein NlpE N-terminal domain-containing protein n=3 Tax=Prevotella heparinolytica TaxID=28113 RepID=UPI0035A0B5EF